MAAAKAQPIENKLITLLRPRAQRDFLRRAEVVELACGDILFEPGTPLRHVYFPLRGFISRIAILDGKFLLDMGLIGNEGMLGAITALDVWDTPMRATVQGTGEALRMTTPAFRRALREVSGLAPLIHHYLYVMIAQLGRSSGCTRFHSIGPRLARWLLMVQDRAHADHFFITQESLANMLGVRRAGVTMAAGDLKRKRLIRYSRGKINILDRRGLMRMSCSCYQAQERDLASLYSAAR